jgi:hypothetical protein
VKLWVVEVCSVTPQNDKWGMWIRRTQAQERIHRYVNVLGRMRDAWTGVRTEVEGTAPSSRDGVRGGGDGKLGGRDVTKARMVSGAIVHGRQWAYKVGSKGDEAETEADAKRVSTRVTLLSLMVWPFREQPVRILYSSIGDRSLGSTCAALL